MKLKDQLESINAHTGIIDMLKEHGKIWSGTESGQIKLVEAICLRIAQIKKDITYAVPKDVAKFLRAGRIRTGLVRVEVRDGWMTSCSSTAVYRERVSGNRAEGIYALIGELLVPAYTFGGETCERVERMSDWRACIEGDDFMTRVKLPDDLGTSDAVYMSLDGNRPVLNCVALDLPTCFSRELALVIRPAKSKDPIFVSLPYTYPACPLKFECGSRVMYLMPMISEHIAKRKVEIQSGWLFEYQRAKVSQMAAAAVVYSVNPKADEDWIFDNVYGIDQRFREWIWIELMDHRGTIDELRYGVVNW